MLARGSAGDRSGIEWRKRGEKDETVFVIDG